MKNLYFLLTTFLLSTGLIHSQNSPEYFKVYNPDDPTIPEWAQKMYSADPDVDEVIQLYNQYYDSHTFIKTIHTQNYKHWLFQISDLVDNQNHIRPRKENIQTKTDVNRNIDLALWAPVGPFETINRTTRLKASVQGNVQCIDQSIINPNLWIAGVEGGGGYITTDAGLNWNPIQQSFDEGHRSVAAVACDPLNVNIMYYFSGDIKTLFKSTNGGASFIPIYTNSPIIYEIKVHPTNNQIVFLASAKGLYRSTNQGSTWTLISAANNCYDVDFHPTNSNIVYAIVNDGDNRDLFYKSIDGGATFTVKSNGYYSNNDPTRLSRGGKIAVSAANSSYVYVGLIGEAKSGDSGWIGIYRSTDSGENWVDMDGQDGGPYGAINSASPWNISAYSSGYHQGFYNFDVEVSDFNPNLLWVGTIRLSESTDGGATFTSIGAANSIRLNQHADIQDLSVVGNSIIVASDGGVDFSTDELQTTESRKNGINGSNFWGLGTGWNEDIIVGGRYHNGNTAYYDKFSLDEDLFLGGAESPTGYVDPLENTIARFHDIGDVQLPSTYSGAVTNLANFALMPNASYSSNNSSGIFYDVTYRDWIYMGNGSSLYKSSNNGESFYVLKNFGNAKVLEVEQPRVNPEILYVSVYNYDNAGIRRGEIWKSEDRGVTWTEIDISLLSNAADLNFIVDQSNSDKLLVVGRANSSVNAIYTTNAGASWTDVSDPLLNYSTITDMFAQPTSNGFIAYASASNIGLRFLESTLQWEQFKNGLPGRFADPLIRPYYAGNKIRMSTRAYGIYETPFAEITEPIIQPLTAQPYNYCETEPIRFDSYSIMDLNGATVNWTFDPEPASVNYIDDRAVDVIMNHSGPLDVTLSITNSTGTYTKTIDSMIVLGNGCSSDIDGDGLTDAFDDDIDGDGLPNTVEKLLALNSNQDSDGDGIVDFKDVDSDDDGFLDKFEGFDCANQAPVNTSLVTSSSPPILVHDFGSQTSGVALVYVKCFVNCYGMYSYNYILVDFDNGILHNAGYKHFNSPSDYEDVILGDGTNQIYSQKTNFGSMYFSLTGNKLYFSVKSQACGSWARINEFCFIRNDSEQDGLLDYLQVPLTLPVDLTEFKGEAENDHNTLSWTVSNTDNLSGIELQKMSQSGLWNRVEWFGRAQLEDNLHFTSKDFNVYENEYSKYRLAFIEENSDNFYSPIIQVYRNQLNGIRLETNLIDDKLQLQFASKNDKIYSARIVNSEGKIIEAFSQIDSGSGEVDLNLNSLNTGFYILLLDSDIQTKPIKFKFFKK